MRNIMVIPGSDAQIELIKKIQSMNYNVVCVNPYSDSPAFQFARYSEQFDILDVDKCLEVAKKYNVVAVMSDECDIAMNTVAAVSEVLGLNSLSSEMASLFTNKRMMREFCLDKGFPCPKFLQCSKVEDAELFFATLDVSKMIIKPLDSNSSRGVYTIHSIKELKKLFSTSLAFSRSVKAVLCEEYIEGTEFTVDGIVLNGKHYSLAVSKKKHYSHHPNIACELYFSHFDEQFDYNALRNQNDQYVNASGLTLGFTHAEYKYNGKEFVLIEIGARGGGNFISSHIVPIMTGEDNYEKLIMETLGIKVNSFSLNKDLFKICAVLKFFDVDVVNNGKVLKSIIGENILKNNEKVLKYSFTCKTGDIVSFAEDDSKRIGFYIAYGNTREELNELMNRIDSNVYFQFEEE